MEGTSFIVPHGQERARAYICTPVDEAIAERSSVMRTLMEFEGFAELPPGVDVSDVLAWTDTYPDNASDMSPEELTQALQVLNAFPRRLGSGCVFVPLIKAQD